MKIKSVRLLISVTSILLSLGALAQEPATNLMTTARKESQARNFDAAKSAFVSVLSASDADASLKVAAHIGIANILLQGPKPQVPGAIAEYEQALALSSLEAKDKLNLLSMAAVAHTRLTPPDWDGAQALYATIVADPAANNSIKISALNSLAGIAIETFDVKTANETIKQALSLADLKPAEELAGLKNMGDLWVRQADYPAARAVYQQMLLVDTNAQNKVGVDRLLAATWIAEGDFDKAVEIHRQGGRVFEMAEVYQKKGDINAAQAELRKFLADATQNENAKITALTQLLRVSLQSLDDETAKKDAETFLPKLMGTNLTQALVLMPVLKAAMEKGNYAIVSWAAPIVMQAPNLADKDYLLCRTYLVNALGAQGKAQEACKIAENAAGDAKLSVTNKFRFKLIGAALASTGKADEMKNASKQAVATLKAGGLSKQDKAASFLQASKSAVMAGKYPAARELYEMYQAMLVPVPRASYRCEFINTAPADVGSWLASPLLKDPKKKAKLTRKYGSNLATLLETDAATASRGVTADSKDSGDTATDLYMACDVNGITFFFLAEDSKVSEVKDGLLSGGSYEGYLAPGAHQAYLTFLIDLPTGSLGDAFHTQYPNRNFRQARKIDDTVKSATLPTDKGFATYVFYPWELFYDKLPENGTAWQFDTIRWTRAGGFSWAGSDSVHNRSSWGDVVFSGLTEKARRDIKRRLIFKASAQYKLERNAGAKGAIQFWQDVELGDPKFYDAALAPVVDRLDELAKKVGKDMTDADVDLLFEQAVPDWMEFKYKAAELRTDYLSDQLFSNAPGK